MTVEHFLILVGLLAASFAVPGFCIGAKLFTLTKYDHDVDLKDFKLLDAGAWARQA